MPRPLNIKFEEVSRDERTELTHLFDSSAGSSVTDEGIAFHPTKFLTYNEIMETMQRDYFTQKELPEGERVGNHCFFWDASKSTGKNVYVIIFNSHLASSFSPPQSEARPPPNYRTRPGTNN